MRISMHRLACVAALIVSLPASVAPALADLDAGATGIFKKADGGQILMVIDWSYVDDEKKAEDQSVMLYSPNNPNSPVGRISFDSLKNPVIVAPGGCKLKVEPNGHGYDVTAGNGGNCKDYRVYSGAYEVMWQSPKAGEEGGEEEAQ